MASASGKAEQLPQRPEEQADGQGDDLPEIREEDAEEVIVLDSRTDSTLHGQADTMDSSSDSADESDDTSDGISTAQNGDSSNMEHAGVEETDVASSPDDAVLTLHGHKSDVLCIAASPTDHRALASGGQDDLGLLWDLEEGVQVGEVDGAGESVSTAAFSVDGSYLALGSENGAIAVVLLDGSDAPRTPLEGPSDAIQFLAWHPRGPVLLAGSADNLAYMWNAAKGAFMQAFAGHEAAVTAGAFSGDGKLIVTASLDMAVRTWNPTTGETLTRVQSGLPGIRGSFHTADLLCLAVGKADTPSSKLVATGCMSGDIFITQFETGQVVAQLQRHEGGAESVAFSPPNVRPVLLATGGGDGKIHVWDAEAGIERCSLYHEGVTVKVVWHPVRALLASASSNGTVTLWDGLKGDQLAIFRGHTAFVTDVCFAGGNNFLASSSADGTVRLFDIRAFTTV
jgi:angio-associated migratory cell protein